MIKKAVIVLVITAAVFIPSTILISSTVLAADKWQGTDDLIDSKMTELTGVSAKEPLIDINQGNLGLFLFTAGGFTAGAVFGYQWRRIFHEKAGSQND